MTNNTNNLLVICGPTASGKTRLGVTLARKLNGEIISADSRQVYHGIDVASGKDIDEYGKGKDRVRCHLIDIVEPSSVYTLYHYQNDCYAAIREIWKRQKIPVLVGGSGLYIEAVLKHYNIDEVPENRGLRQELGAFTKTDLEKMLKEKSPEIYRQTDLGSKKRIVRSLERAFYSQSCRQERPKHAQPRLNPLVICVHFPRRELLERIDSRLENRLKQGMVDEVKGMVEQGISRDRIAMFGMECKHIAKFVYGEIGYRRMVDDLRTDIHRLAKRQMTYFRGMQRRGIDIKWIFRACLQDASTVVSQHSFTACAKTG